MEKIFENFTTNILRMNKYVNKIKTFEMKEYGLKAIHVMCIYYLSENPKGLKAAELAKLTMEDKAAISRGLTQLKGNGYVSYDSDKYNAEIRLTEKGVELAKAIAKKSQRAVDESIAPFTEEERIAFYKSMQVIADNLKVYYEKLSGGNL